jgi:hypothetical protein
MKFRFLLSVLTAAAVALAADAATAKAVKKPAQPGTTKPAPPVKAPITRGQKPGGGTVIDVRPTVAQIHKRKVRSGKSLVHTSDQGVKLWLIVNNGKTTGWAATDKNGKSLPVKFMSSSPKVAAAVASCRVCVTTPIEGGQSIEICYEVDCKDIPKPKDRK